MNQDSSNKISRFIHVVLFLHEADFYNLQDLRDIHLHQSEQISNLP